MKKIFALIVFSLIVLAACQNQEVKPPVVAEENLTPACDNPDLSVDSIVVPDLISFANQYGINVKVSYNPGSCAPLSSYTLSLYDNNNLVEEKTVANPKTETLGFSWLASPEGEHTFKAQLTGDVNALNNELSSAVTVEPMGFLDVSGSKYDQVTGLDKKAHSFTPAMPIVITGIDIYIKRFSDVSDVAKVNVQIRTDDNGKPSRTDVASANIDLSPVPAEFSWQTATFATPVQLDAKRYWVLIVATGSRGQFYWHYQANLAPDQNQTEYSARTSGPSYGVTDEYWNYLKGYDYNFRIRTT